MYLLYDDATHQALVIDPAIDSGEAFARAHELENAGYELIAIWNTHGHFDHVYDNARWKSAFDVPIWMHSLDNFLIEHLREQSIWLGLPAPEVALPDHDWQGVSQTKFAGHEVHVSHVPGHSPGSVAFHFHDHDWCFSGDVLFKGGVGRTDLPGCSESDLKKSLQVLAALPEQTRIWPGHGNDTTIGEEKRTNPFLQR